SQRSAGRPSLYRPDYCDRIIEAMASGLSAEAAAAKIGISARSLFYWQQQHPEFFAGHSGGAPEVSALVGGRRDCHGQRKGRQYADRDARTTEPQPCRYRVEQRLDEARALRTRRRSRSD